MGFATQVHMTVDLIPFVPLLQMNFLEFSKSRGNDLSTPVPEFEFPGLVDGQSWCLCANRWLEAHSHKRAPKVF